MAEIRAITLGIGRLAARLSVLAQRALGLLGAGEQLLLHAAHPSTVALAVSGMLLAGAQAVESLVLATLDRLMALPKPPETNQDSKTVAKPTQNGE